MDPRKFYGGIHTIIQEFPNGSSDDELSDDDDYRRRAKKRPLVILSESDSDTEDDIPLSELPSTSSRANRNAKPRWRDGFLEKTETEIQFLGNTSLPADIMQLKTPVQFFKYLFTDDMFHYITQETLKYAVEKRPEKPMIVTSADIEQFVGICLMMSIIQLPSTRDFVYVL
ncbi:unnamed protein product [Arctia plantaginis]|uniref:PiggyBac transposable element-derived protein domain-containing protein n=1 Tax=Arctia plantaginis TaxID=874455 RepID=A0A8S1AXW4_ARCPL|nr:unnamed protein product [Arctia plantaginis]